MRCYNKLANMLFLFIIIIYCMLEAQIGMGNVINKEIGMGETKKINFLRQGRECGGTLCKASLGRSRCCIFKNAECCLDGNYCSPNGFRCNRFGILMKKDIVTTKDLSKNNVVVGGGCIMCPDGSECPNFYTCCELASGHYGCCQFYEGVCCADHTNCCPQYTICDMKTKRCINNSFNSSLVPMIDASYALPVEEGHTL